MVYFIVIIIYAVVCGIIAGSIGDKKGVNGFWWGFLLGVLGIIVVALMPINYNTSSGNSSEYHSSSASDSNSNLLGVHRDKMLNIAAQTWMCARCHTVNPGTTGTCSCGLTKNESKQIEANKARRAKEENRPEKDKIEMVKQYKELLDAGVISQEEFDKKKAELLQL